MKSDCLLLVPGFLLEEAVGLSLAELEQLLLDHLVLQLKLFLHHLAS
jgi:hypothetical protein